MPDEQYRELKPLPDAEAAFTRCIVHPELRIHPP